MEKVDGISLPILKDRVVLFVATAKAEKSKKMWKKGNASANAMRRMSFSAGANPFAAKKSNNAMMIQVNHNRIVLSLRVVAIP